MEGYGSVQGEVIMVRRVPGFLSSYVFNLLGSLMVILDSPFVF